MKKKSRKNKTENEIIKLNGVEKEEKEMLEETKINKNNLKTVSRKSVRIHAEWRKTNKKKTQKKKTRKEIKDEMTDDRTEG